MIKEAESCDQAKVILGGSDKISREHLYVCPTVIENPKLTSKSMVEENFCPVLPILKYTDFDKEVVEPILNRDKPLAIYYFGSKGDQYWQKLE